jgi:hypothetical protein
MELVEFLRQTQNDVRTREGGPYAELTFAEVVMQHMSDIGMTFEPQICHYAAKVGNANLRLSGYAISEEADQLDLFVSLYSGVDTIHTITKEETFEAAKQCLQFLKKCVEGRLPKTMDETNDAYPLAMNIQGSYANLDQIRIYVLTDRQAKIKNFKPQEVKGKAVKLEIMDIERLHNHWSEGKPRDELVVNFEEVSGAPLPCVFVPGSLSDYDYALTVIPGEALRFIYEKYGARLLEANVRSFLSVTGKVNKGIRDTLRNNPERFMAYNNGIVVVADEAHIGTAADGGRGIIWLKGMQIVNGGQTTASIYFTKRKNHEVDLSQVRVPAKVIILRSDDIVAEEALISDISRYANSQNSVKQSDLSANKPFHVELEKLALTTYCPDGIGRWFYERAAGSYNTMLDLKGATNSQKKKIKETIPPSRKITKTELAKYLNSWDKKPDLVSLGAQKNFEKFMESVTQEEGRLAPTLPDVAIYKAMIAKAIVFKITHSIVRSNFRADQGNTAAYTAYLVSVLSDLLGDRIILEKIWEQQDISGPLREQLKVWAEEVRNILKRSSNGSSISEWAKKPGCWNAVRSASYSPLNGVIPEVR